MSDHTDQETKEFFFEISRWRESERTHMIDSLRELIDEAKKKAKARRSSPNERIKWTRLAGQLIWYKDSILRSMTQEGLEREVIILKDKVFRRQPKEKPKPHFTYSPSKPAPAEHSDKIQENNDSKPDNPDKA